MSYYSAQRKFSQKTAFDEFADVYDASLRNSQTQFAATLIDNIQGNTIHKSSRFCLSKKFKQFSFKCTHKVLIFINKSKFRISVGKTIH